MDQVEGVCRRVISGHIVSANIDVASRDWSLPSSTSMSVANTWPEGPTRADSHWGDRWPANADLPAPPSLVDAEHSDVPKGHGIEQRRKTVEALLCFISTVLEEIVAVAGGGWVGHHPDSCRQSP